MKNYLIVMAIFAALPLSCEGSTFAYRNTFDTTSSLDDFTLFGETFISFSPPPLHRVFIESGQLKIETDYLQPNGPSAPPTLMGRATLMLDSSSFGGAYHTIISESSGKVSWGFNTANQDGRFNNEFHFVLLSSKENPREPGAVGYAFKGGGMVGNRMMLFRFSSGLNIGQVPLVDVADGLGTLPEKGSIRISYDPSTDEWRLFAYTGPDFIDPVSVDTLLGSAIDGTYTGEETRFMGFGGGTTGLNIFDNVTVSVASEFPAPLARPFKLSRSSFGLDWWIEEISELSCGGAEVAGKAIGGRGNFAHLGAATLEMSVAWNVEEAVADPSQSLFQPAGPAGGPYYPLLGPEDYPYAFKFNPFDQEECGDQVVSATGEVVLTAANRDLLFGRVIGGEAHRLDFHQEGDGIETFAFIEFDGGTGRFAAATGTFVLHIIGRFDIATGSFAIEFADVLPGGTLAYRDLVEDRADGVMP